MCTINFTNENLTSINTSSERRSSFHEWRQNFNISHDFLYQIKINSGFLNIYFLEHNTSDGAVYKGLLLYGECALSSNSGCYNVIVRASKRNYSMPYVCVCVCSDKVLKSCRELCKQPALKRLYYMLMLYRLERLVFW